MADFKEVMRQYKRMCHTYPQCNGCPFHTELEWGCCRLEVLTEEEEINILPITKKEK